MAKSSKLGRVEREGDGNTKSPSHNAVRARHWALTINNYADNYLTMFQGPTYSIIGREIGDEGTPHLQCHVYYKSKVSFKQVKEAFPTAHIEQARNIDASIVYCKKGGMYEEIGQQPKWKGGNCKPKKEEFVQSIAKLKPWQIQILDKMNGTADDRSIYWYWSIKGGVGKTTFQKYVYSSKEYDDVIILSGKAEDMKMAIVQYIEASGHFPKTILIDIPKCNIDYLSYNGLESIKNMFFFSGKYEGGMVCGPPPHVFVFANSEPDYDKMTSRFVVEQLDRNESIDREGLRGSPFVKNNLEEMGL